MKIRNNLVLFLVGGYVALAPLAGFTAAEIGANFIVALVVLLAMFIAFSLGWIGGGDAKLTSAVTLWVGAQHTLDFLAYTAVFGGVLSFIILQFRSIVLPYQLLRMSWIIRLHGSNTGVPYGVAIALGGIISFQDTVWTAAVR
jgi:prepilin peptidase CpaA